MGRRVTIRVCHFCGTHYEEKDLNLHGENCHKNPEIKSCITCYRNNKNKCKLNLIPIDFIKKKKIGRYCPSWISIISNPIDIAKENHKQEIKNEIGRNSQ